jgi:hypothetical protein
MLKQVCHNLQCLKNENMPNQRKHESTLGLHSSCHDSSSVIFVNANELYPRLGQLLPFPEVTTSFVPVLPDSILYLLFFPVIVTLHFLIPGYHQSQIT